VRDDAFTERLARGVVGSKTPVDVIDIVLPVSGERSDSFGAPRQM
jgi:hypothetical protein